MNVWVLGIRFRWLSARPQITWGYELFFLLAASFVQAVWPEYYSSTYFCPKQLFFRMAVHVMLHPSTTWGFAVQIAIPANQNCRNTWYLDTPHLVCAKNEGTSPPRPLARFLHHCEPFLDKAAVTFSRHNRFGPLHWGHLVQSHGSGRLLLDGASLRMGRLSVYFLFKYRAWTIASCLRQTSVHLSWVFRLPSLKPFEQKPCLEVPRPWRQPRDQVEEAQVCTLQIRTLNLNRD